MLTSHVSLDTCLQVPTPSYVLITESPAHAHAIHSLSAAHMTYASGGTTRSCCRHFVLQRRPMSRWMHPPQTRSYYRQNIHTTWAPPLLVDGIRYMPTPKQPVAAMVYMHHAHGLGCERTAYVFYTLYKNASQPTCPAAFCSRYPLHTYRNTLASARAIHTTHIPWGSAATRPQDST